MKATAASVAISAATAGRFVLDASERDGGTLLRRASFAGPADCGPSGRAESATRARAAGCS